MLAFAQLTKCLIWMLLSYVALGPALALPAIIELVGVLILLRKHRASWLILMTICIVELFACAWFTIRSLTFMPPILLTGSMVLAGTGFGMVWITALLQMVVANTKDVKTHYLGGQPPPFKPTYADTSPEPQF